MDSCICSTMTGENRFETISDFKWCVNCGGEIQFEWHGKVFGIWLKLCNTPESPLQILNILNNPGLEHPFINLLGVFLIVPQL